MASLTTRFENLFHCLFFLITLFPAIITKLSSLQIDWLFFIWHLRLIEPVFPKQHMDRALMPYFCSSSLYALFHLTVSSVRTVVLSWWLFYDCYEMGQILRKLLSHWWSWLAYALMIYLVCVLVCYTREEFTSSHFLKVEGGIGRPKKF